MSDPRQYRIGQVFRSPRGVLVALDHVEHRDDDADRLRFRSVKWGVLLTGRYTWADLERGVLAATED